METYCGPHQIGEEEPHHHPECRRPGVHRTDRCRRPVERTNQISHLAAALEPGGRRGIACQTPKTVTCHQLSCSEPPVRMSACRQRIAKPVLNQDARPPVSAGLGVGKATSGPKPGWKCPSADAEGTEGAPFLRAGESRRGSQCIMLDAGAPTFRTVIRRITHATIHVRTACHTDLRRRLAVSSGAVIAPDCLNANRSVRRETTRPRDDRHRQRA